MYGPKVFLLTKVKREYSDILYNETHFPSTFVCWIRQVPVHMYKWNIRNEDTNSLLVFSVVRVAQNLFLQ